MSIFKSKIHCHSPFCILIFLSRPHSLFLICRHLVVLFSSVTLGFPPMSMVEIEQWWIEWQLTVECPHQSQRPYHWLFFFFYTSHCALLRPPESLTLFNITSQSQWLQWHTKEMVIWLWHLSHSTCHSSPGNYQRQQAHPMCWREACRDGGSKRGEKGVGVWKEGLEDSFCSVLSLQISKSKSIAS